MGSSGFGLIPEGNGDPAFTFSEKNECVLESVCCVVSRDTKRMEYKEEECLRRKCKSRRTRIRSRTCAVSISNPSSLKGLMGGGDKEAHKPVILAWQQETARKPYFTPSRRWEPTLRLLSDLGIHAVACMLTSHKEVYIHTYIPNIMCIVSVKPSVPSLVLQNCYQEKETEPSPKYPWMEQLGCHPKLWVF